MACTAVAQISSTGRAPTTNLPSAMNPSFKLGTLHTFPNLVLPPKGFAVACTNGARRAAGDQPLNKVALHQTRHPRDSSLRVLDSWDPFSRGGLRQMMDTMDRLFLDDIPAARARGGTTRTGGIRAPWDVTEDEEGFYIRVDMPGFCKEDVKVTVEDGVLVVTGNRDPSKEDSRWAAKSYSKFNTRLSLPDNACLDKISAELKNGVLFVTVPKLKPEDRKQVFDVDVA